jgi:hypothetical protein
MLRKGREMNEKVQKQLNSIERQLNEVEEGIRSEATSKNKYIARWQEYDRGPAPEITIKFSAKDDADALLKIFVKKVLSDWGREALTFDEFKEEIDATAEPTLEWLTSFFDNIDVGGGAFLVRLDNITTGKVVFDIGFEPDNDEEWDEDEDGEGSYEETE